MMVEQQSEVDAFDNDRECAGTGTKLKQDFNAHWLSISCRGSLTFCMIMLSIVVVSMVFLGTYIFIKTTSFVGYKGRPR